MKMKSLKEFNVENNTLNTNSMCKVMGGCIDRTTWHDSCHNGTDTYDTESKTGLANDFKKD